MDGDPMADARRIARGRDTTSIARGAHAVRAPVAESAAAPSWYTQSEAEPSASTSPRTAPSVEAPR